MRLGTAAVAVGLVLVSSTAVAVTVVGPSDENGRQDLVAQPAAVAEPSQISLPVAAAPLAVPVLPAVPVAPVPVAPAPVAPTAAPPSPVAKLSKTITPDLLVRSRAPLTGKQVAALREIDGLQGLATFRTVAVVVGGNKAQALGVDPSTFRAFTPLETAQSDALWGVVAKGELTAAYALDRAKPLPLGGDLVVSGTKTQTKRLGARASIGLPGVDLLVNPSTAASFGNNGGGAVLRASERTVSSLERAVKKAVGPGAEITVLRAKPAASVGTGRPTSYRELYIRSATLCPGLSWTILASIGQIESGHGRNLGPSSAGALGPMQFMPATWAYYGVDGDRDGSADIMSPFDAVPSAAGYLCRNGAGRGGDDLYNAIFAYNHADWYVKKVLALAAKYG